MGEEFDAELFTLLVKYPKCSDNEKGKGKEMDKGKWKRRLKGRGREREKKRGKRTSFTHERGENRGYMLLSCLPISWSPSRSRMKVSHPGRWTVRACGV